MSPFRMLWLPPDTTQTCTVCPLFVWASLWCEIWSREKCLVAQHMFEHCGTDWHSMITGSFVHNQRIERLWRDMHRCAIKLFYRLFYYLEEQGVLNPDNDVHIYVLHYIYIPRVNDTLTAFKGWNCHGVRTEHDQSPNKLLVEHSTCSCQGWLH